MIILQYQLTNTTEEELELIPEFNDWICTQIFENINTKLNRRKIQLRLDYIYKVPWIQWTNTKYLDESDIMNSIYESLITVEHRDKIFIIQTDINMKIPNTNTSMDRLIRFFEFGDRNIRPMNMISKISQQFNHMKLNGLWNLFVMNKLGNMSQAKIILK